MSTQAEFLSAYAEASHALAQLRPHLDALWALAHEPKRGDVARRSSSVVDVGQVGDPETREALRYLENACLSVKRHADFLWGSLQVGLRDDSLRGSALTAEEFDRLLAAQLKRGSEARLVPQPRNTVDL